LLEGVFTPFLIKYAGKNPTFEFKHTDFCRITNATLHLLVVIPADFVRVVKNKPHRHSWQLENFQYYTSRGQTLQIFCTELRDVLWKRLVYYSFLSENTV
jgi:hypothetical protein